MFASPIGTATPNTLYTQQSAKQACQEDINAKLSHLLLAQLPRTQFTHSKAPNPHASKTAAQKFSHLLLAQLPRTHFTHSKAPNPNASKDINVKFFASPIGTATPSTLYTQRGAKHSCQEDINAKCSHLLLAQLPRTHFTLLLAQLPRTQFTHSKAPNPHVSKTSAQNFRISYWHSNPEHSLHTARRQTRMPVKTSAQFSYILLAQLPRTHFTHSKAPNPHASKTSAQNFRISYWHSYPKHTLHTASCQTRMSARHQHKIFASPIGTATPSTLYTQRGAKQARQETSTQKFSHLLLAQLPRTHFTHSKAPNPHASKDINVKFSHLLYWHSYPEHTLHTASCQNSMDGRHQQKIFASPIGTAAPNTPYTQQAAKPTWQDDINTKFSRLLLAQLPRTHFTHSKAPNPNVSKTSAQSFRISYRHSYPEHSLHRARRQTRTSARHQRTATPNTVYTEQGAKPACQQVLLRM